MPAKSEKQRRAAGAAYGAKCKGGDSKLKGSSKQMAEGMNCDQLRDFAKKAKWLEGWCDKCAELGADPEELLDTKQAYEQWSAMPPQRIDQSDYYSDKGTSPTVGSTKTPRTAGSTPQARIASKPTPASDPTSGSTSSSTPKSTPQPTGNSNRAPATPHTAVTKSPSSPTPSPAPSRAPATPHTPITKSPADPQRTEAPAPSRPSPVSRDFEHTAPRKPWLSALRFDSPGTPWQQAIPSTQSADTPALSAYDFSGLSALLGGGEAIGGGGEAIDGGGEGGGEGGGGGAAAGGGGE